MPARTARRGLIAAILLTIAVAALPAVAGQRPATAGARIDAGLLAQFDTKGTTSTHFFVVLRPAADLAGLPAARAARTGTVVNRLKQTATASQAGIRAMLTARKAPFQSFWIANTVRVEGDRNLAEALAARPEVAQVVAERSMRIPRPAPGQARAQAVGGIEWNVARIRAPEAWSSFGDKGQGIVVASIDSGVQYDHPALLRSYRGNKGNGTIDHNYNWYDPAHICPTAAPCDNNGHGTHTLGTIVGDDGRGNQIGVAPGARWIAAKGCEEFSCSPGSLLAAGQWVMAPTDLNGANPRPDLAPHVVNNSWGGQSTETFYDGMLRAWVAAGIFPVFAAGNDGPSCHTAADPGDQVLAYSVGSFSADNRILFDSSRGPAAGTGEIKPNIAAPGGDIRSSVPGSGYALDSGTSMAAPHVTGTVALMWAAAPSLVRNITRTRQLLDDTAIDTPAGQCGGTTDDNNVFGEGRLDAFTAVNLARDGTLRGSVADFRDRPITGATVRILGPVTRSTTTRAGGFWTLAVPAGTYTVTVSSPGWRSVTRRGLVVSSGATTNLEVLLTRREFLPRPPCERPCPV